MAVAIVISYPDRCGQRRVRCFQHLHGASLFLLQTFINETPDQFGCFQPGSFRHLSQLLDLNFTQPDGRSFHGIEYGRQPYSCQAKSSSAEKFLRDVEGILIPEIMQLGIRVHPYQLG